MSVPQDYRRPDFDEQGSSTKSRILDIATRLFAQKGFKATLKDVADELGLTLPALYKHYKGKDELIDEVMKRFVKVHRYYNSWLHKEIEKAESVEGIMDVLFNDSFLTGVDPVGRQCMAVVMKEQHDSKSIYRAVLTTLYSEAIQNISGGFDRLIDKGVIPPSDTHTLAAIFMFCIMSLNDLHIHEGADTVTPFDRDRIYGGLRAMMTVSINHGTIAEH